MRNPRAPWRRGGGSPRGADDAGAILIMVLVVLVLFGILGAGLLDLGSSDGAETGKAVSAAQAFWCAEAGIQHARFLAQKARKPCASIPVATSPSGYLYGSNALSGTTSRGGYSVDVLDDPAWTNAVHSVKRYIIRATGTSPGGATVVLTQRAEIQTYASYMHASNLERQPSGSPIYFGTGDILDGPVYINDQINIYGTPQFLQLVSSASASVNYTSGGTVAVFQGGLVLNAPALDVSGQFSSDHITDVKNQAMSGGLALTGNYRFVFNANGSFTYRPVSGGAAVTNYLASLNSGRGAIYVNGAAYVQGSVNGTVTLAAQDTIYIPSNIVYASATSPDPWSALFNLAAVDDQLGLMASNAVQVTSSQAITIHATIMVTTGDNGFNASYWNQSIGNPYINLFGGVSQYRRGVVGQASGTGFRKNYKFDQRFLSDAPPNFPYSVYVFSQWKRSG